MPRISKSEFERIKQDVSLVRLVEMEGFKLSKQGRDYVLLCPFHREKTPLLSDQPTSKSASLFWLSTIPIHP